MILVCSFWAGGIKQEHVAKFIVRAWGYKVDSGIGFSYRPARLCRLAGRYDNPAESTLFPFRDHKFGYSRRIPLYRQPPLAIYRHISIHTQREERIRGREWGAIVAGGKGEGRSQF